MGLAAWVGSGGAALVIIGALTLAAVGLVAPEDAALAQATTVDGSADARDEPTSPTWRDAVLMAGGICLVAGFGLLVLAVISGRVGAR